MRGWSPRGSPIPCWGSYDQRYAHDLLPLPYTEEALAHVVERVQRVQERLGRGILLENVSSYVAFRDSAVPEWEFLADACRPCRRRAPARRWRREAEAERHMIST